MVKKSAEGLFRTSSGSAFHAGLPVCCIVLDCPSSGQGGDISGTGKVGSDLGARG
jgi:hypothetical protein